jgi:outer membrane protein assembly factor BamA
MKRFLAILLIVIPLAGLAMLISSAQTDSHSGQSMPASAYKLIAVKVTGTKRFTPDQVAAASGLPVGTVAHEEDFKKAARQLGETGAFSNISYTFAYSTDGTKLEFQVTDAEKFVPARFADFVWFTDEELVHRIREYVPLFDGELPATGRMADQVSDVLQAMLVQKGVPGQVEYTRATDKSDKLESFDYNVVGVSIRIHAANFPGAGPTELPLLQTAAEGVLNREYSRAYMGNFIERSVLPVYREHGYLKASCATPVPKVVVVKSAEPTVNGQPPTFVDVTFPVTPGMQYKVAGWQWAGNKALSTDELQPFIHLKVGEIANTVQLEDELRAVQADYGSRGYILAAIKVNAEFDDSAGTVQYHLDVDENSIFRMGELEFRGLDNNLTARLRAAWKIRPGDIYDGSYLDQYLPLSRKLLPTSVDWEISSHVTPITTEKVVDVDLQYMAKAPR